MGQKNDKPPVNPNDFYCAIHMETLHIKHSKVLACGHCFCEECLAMWQDQRMGVCPNCRYEDRRNVADLPGYLEHEGAIYLDKEPKENDTVDIQDMIHAQIVRRAKTMRILREAANAVTSIELTTAGVKIGGAAAGLVGTGLVITGGVLSLTGVGAIAGVPLALAGAAVGGAGGLTVGGGIIGEIIAKNKQLASANDCLQSDFFHSMQLKILFGRAIGNDNFARRFNIQPEDAASFVGIIGRSVKFGLATANLVKASAVGVARGVGTAGLHVAGIVISAVLIPVDLFQMIKSSIRVHKKEKAEIAIELEKIAGELENQLIPVLKERGYEIAEIERLDSEQKKHTLLLAIERSKYEEVLNDSNISIDSVEENLVILLDTPGDELDPEMLEEILTKFASEDNLKIDEETDSENDEDDHDLFGE